MVKRNVFFTSLIFLLFSAAVFAEVAVVNPVAGNFANQQTLVIEANEGEEIYYSFSGSDPLSSGLAYDGPVLLEVTGNVQLRIATIDKSLKHNETTISYTVTPATTQNAEHSAFLESMEQGAVAEYVAGEKISIPFTMSYSFGSTFEKGKELSISQDAAVERYLPISVRDESNEWRYVLHITPAKAGLLSKHDVPFRIENWTKLIFTDKKKLYSLDGEWWHSSNEILTIDRSVPNTVYYQSAEFSSGNPVTKITLPPKPELKVEHLYGGGIKISVEKNYFSSYGETYKLSASSFSARHLIAEGLYSEIFLDVFSGDKIEDNIPLDIYSDGIYQGTLFASLFVNRTTPQIPTIKSSAKGYYSRDNVDVIASAPKNLKLYVGISDAVEIPVDFDLSNSPELNFENPTFSLYNGEKITFFADTEKILAYQVSFYSEDPLGAKSQTVSYSVIVDKYNYYVDSISTSEMQDGTPFAPFKDLSKLQKIVNANNFSRFCIKGVVQMNPGEVSLNSNVEFRGINGGKIQLQENSVIIMKNAGFFAENLTFEKVSKNAMLKKTRGAAKALTNIFVIENSAATFNNCELLANFSGDGNALNLSSSALSLNKTVVVTNAQGYASALSALSSKIKISDSRLLCISDTSVGLSINGGTIELAHSFIQVTARLARIAELLNTTASLEKNKFSAELSSKKSQDDLIYKTLETEIIKNEGNIFQ